MMTASRPFGVLHGVRAAAIATAILIATPLALTAGVPAQAATCANPVACENALPGAAPSEWDIVGAGDPSIQGFGDDISVGAGEEIGFKIDTDASAYSIRIYRLGWYQGFGARQVATVEPTAKLPQRQPECINDEPTGLYDCGTWKQSAAWEVPEDAVSGVYVALLQRPDTGGRSHIIFVVRDDGGVADILFQTSDPTWQAYNTYGGSSFYQGGAAGRAFKVSYNRPFATREGVTARDFFFSSEYATVRFLERNGYDVSYASGVDTDRFGGELMRHRVVMSVGHDEYWSGAQRANIEAARDAGVNLHFLGGNDGYWRTRYEPAASSDGTDHRTLVTYKETWDNKKIDPSAEWTGTWRDPRFSSPADGGGMPENSLIGTMFRSNHDDLPVTVSSDEGRLRFWRNTSLSSLPSGTNEELAPHTVGYESNEDVINHVRPDGLIHLSTTTGFTPDLLTDFGSTLRAGTTTHNTTLYRAPSGALVFSAGSVQWAWGLDQTHDGAGSAADPRMQQSQVNLLADMGVQPATLASPLVAAEPSTDTVPPTVQPDAAGHVVEVAAGRPTTLTGTATDTGGTVAGVEASTDGGATWKPADGAERWSFTYLPEGIGDRDVLIRAIDDSANFPTLPARVKTTVIGPFSVLGDAVPEFSDGGDSTPLELGLRFTPTVDGVITGVRFYKSPENTGTHTGTLWDAVGTVLGNTVFEAESTEGWQTASFDIPIPVRSGEEYVVSYTAPKGHYSADNSWWGYHGAQAGPLLVAGGLDTAPAGQYAQPGEFPSQIFFNANYFVDALFEPVADAMVTGISSRPMPGATGVSLTSHVAVLLSHPTPERPIELAVESEGEQIPGTTTYDPDGGVVTFVPDAPLERGQRHTVSVTAVDPGETTVSGVRTWGFTTSPWAAKFSCEPPECSSTERLLCERVVHRYGMSPWNRIPFPFCEPLDPHSGAG